MRAKPPPGEYDSLNEWSDALFYAHGNPKSAFWKTAHLNLREMPRHAVNEAMMVEKLWEWMGPQEHRWFATYMPDVRERYPRETSEVNPWNHEMAGLHYGLPPLFSSGVLDSLNLSKHPVPLADIRQSWVDARHAHSMPIDCWQLVQEMIDFYHARDSWDISQRGCYCHNADKQQMQRLQDLAPSSDWPLALACAGIASHGLLDGVDDNTLDAKGHQAVAWLQWWLDKSPDCLDNLVYSWVNMRQKFVPLIDPTTALLLDLNSSAKEPKDTFALTRQTYCPPAHDFSIDSTMLGNALDAPATP